eukprot:512953-Rhodomonas_salina.2
MAMRVGSGRERLWGTDRDSASTAPAVRSTATALPDRSKGLEPILKVGGGKWEVGFDRERERERELDRQLDSQTARQPDS